MAQNDKNVKETVPQEEITVQTTEDIVTEEPIVEEVHEEPVVEEPVSEPEVPETNVKVQTSSNHTDEHGRVITRRNLFIELRKNRTRNF